LTKQSSLLSNDILQNLHRDNCVADKTKFNINLLHLLTPTGKS